MTAQARPFPADLLGISAAVVLVLLLVLTVLGVSANVAFA